MRNLLKTTVFAAASALVLGATANAAVFVQGEASGDPIVSPTEGTITQENGVEFINDDLNLMGPTILENNRAFITVGEGVTQIRLDFNVDQAFPNGPNSRGIQDFAIMVEGTMGSMFMLTGITGPDGVINLDVLNAPQMFEVVAGEVLTFVFSGTAFANGTEFTPGYSVGAFAVDAVPLPAAGLLFATAIVGGAAARRRKAQ